MKLKNVVGGSLASLLCLAGCNTPVRSETPKSSGSLALSADDGQLFAADTDNGVVAVIDTKSNSKLYTVKVGAQPFRLAIAHDDTLYVANRGSRSVSVIRAGAREVSAEVPTGVDPVGLAVSPDDKTLYVVSATSSATTDFGTLTAVDTATLQPRWEVEIGNEPRGIALIDGGKRAVISLYRDGDLVEVDLTTQTVKQGTDLYAKSNRSGLTTNAGFNSPGSFQTPTFHPRAMNDVIASPTGNRVFVPTLWDREVAITTTPTPGVGYYSNGGPCTTGAIASAGIVTVDTSSTTLDPQVDDVSDCSFSAPGSNSGAPYPSSSLGVSGFGTAGTPIQGPTVGVVDATGEWLYLVNKETHNLSVVSAQRRVANANGSGTTSGFGVPADNVSVHSTAAIIGEGPDGVALSRDGSRAWVYSQFDHQVESFGLDATRTRVVNQLAHVKVADDVLTAEQALGRKLFFNAANEALSSKASSVACSTCHLEGREDAHVWKFPDGPRQTPSLAGRGTLDTRPYHWSGEFATLTEFMNHTISSRMGGRGLTTPEANALDAFIGAIPAPENANQHAELTQAQAHGAQVFQSAGCGTCHTGQWLTNDKMEDVGTLVLTGAVVDKVQNGLNVPSLRGIARTGPYLHDGSAATLFDRLKTNPGDKHGVTSRLSDGDRADLVEFLKTL